MASREMEGLFAEIDSTTALVPESADSSDRYPANSRWDQRSMEILRARTGVFSQMLQEAVDFDIPLPFRTGSAAAKFQELEAVTRAELDEISLELNRDVIYGDNYRSQETKDLLKTEKYSGLGNKLYIEAASKSHIKRNDELAWSLVEESSPSSVYFADSPYVSMENVYRSCELAAFLMLYNANTGSDLITPEASEVIGRDYQCAVTSLPDYTFPKMFNTSVLQEAYTDLKCRSIVFAGCTLDDLAKVVNKISDRSPDAEIRAVLSVFSNESGVYSIMHNVVPLSITPEITIAHDPADYGDAYHEFDTDELLRRWYMAYGAGFLLITQSSDS